MAFCLNWRPIHGQPDADESGHAAAMIAAAHRNNYAQQVTSDRVGFDFPGLGAGRSGAHQQGVSKDGVVGEEGVVPPLICITGCPCESGSGALPSGVLKEGDVDHACTSAGHRYLQLGSTVNDAPRVLPVGSSLALLSFTRASVPGGSLAATPSFQLQGGALDVGFSEGPCIGVGARESPPTTGDAESLELGVRRTPVTMQGLTGCSQQPGHGTTASAAHGSIVNTNAEGRPPSATVVPQGSCVQRPHRLAYSAYRGGVQK